MIQAFKNQTITAIQQNIIQIRLALTFDKGIKIEGIDILDANIQDYDHRGSPHCW